jgi:hypothetical protein
MGETQVAEGPLIKHVPGGYAEWRAKESGLPPARLRTSEGEWWGKLVGPTDTLDVDAGIGGGDVGGGDGGGIVSPDPNFIQPEPIEPDYTEPEVDLGGLKTDRTPTDWSTDFEIPKGYGWGTPDATLPYGGGLDAGDITGRTPRERDFRFYDYPGMTDPPMIGPQLPTKLDDRTLGTRFQDPIVIRHPRPLTGETIQNITGKPSLGDEKPFKFYDSKWNPDSFSNRVKGITTDVLRGVESMSDAILGETQYDQYPRPPKEKELGRLLGKWKDLMEGKGEEGLLLWETQGVPSSLGDRTPFGPDYIDTLKNLDKIIKNEHNIKTQEYGQLQVIAIMNMAKLISMYGPIGAVPATVLTLAKDIMSGFKNAFADHPEFRGNPVQDLVHGTTWILGQTLEKTYNATLRKLVDKVDGEKLKEKLSKLNIIEYMKTPDVPTGVKITYTPPKTTRLSGRGGEPQMPTPIIPPIIPPPRPTEVFEDAEIMREKKFPTGQPTATSPTQGQPIIDDREEFKGQPITGKVRGETVGYDVDPRDSQDYRDAIPPQIREKQPLEGDPGGGITGQVTGEPVREITGEEAQGTGGVIDAETMLKIRQQVGLERRQTQFKETGKFKNDAVNEAFTKGAYNWLEHGADNYTGEVDTDHLSNASANADIDKAIGDLNYHYDQLAEEISWSAAYDNYSDRQDALADVERDRQSAIAGYESQRSNIQDSQAQGEGLVEFTTQSAVGIYLNNPGISPEEAVDQAYNQAQNARVGIIEDTREDSALKSSDFWQDINKQITGQISNIGQKTRDAESASNTAEAEQREDDFEAQQAATQAIKDKSDKQLAQNQADAKAFTEEMKAYYEKLAETEPLLGAKGSADLAKLGVTGKIVYSGKDGGIVLVKDKDGKVVSYAYVDPTDKKLIDETMDGWISEDDDYLKGKPTVVMDPETMIPGP